MSVLRTAALTGLVWAGLASLSQAQVKLQFQFPEKSEFVLSAHTRADQVLTINGQEVPTKSENDVSFHRSIGAKRADGTIPLRQSIAALKTVLELPGGINLTIDSEDLADAPKDEMETLKALREALKGVVGASWTVVIDKDGKVASIEGAENALPKLDGINPAIADQIKKRFEADKLKRDSVEEFGLLPNLLLRPGEPWDRTEIMDLGGNQTLTFERQYEYAGTVEQEGRTLHKLTSKAKSVQYKIDAGPESPVQVPSSNLKVESSSGTVLFDPAIGQVVLSQNKTRITGDMTLRINGTDLPSKLDLTLESQTTLKPRKS